LKIALHRDHRRKPELDGFVTRTRQQAGAIQHPLGIGEPL
jgi:hypothetical protein